MNITLLNSKMRSILIFGAFILLNCNDCASIKTVTFIYDKPNTTAHDILWLGKQIERIASIRSNDGMDVLYKLSFPYAYINETLRTITITPRNDSNIEVLSTLETLLTRLQKSPPYSVIYVITNITKPSNETLIGDILEEIQIKRAQVNFLIGTEFSFREDSLQEYGLITSISNGYIMGPKLFQHDKFVDSIHLRLNSVPQKVHLLVFDDNTGNGTYCTDVDSFLNAAVESMVFSSFESNVYEIHAARPHRTTLTNAIESHNRWTLAVTQYTEICADKKTNPEDISQVFLRGFSKNNFDFNYGFSIEEVRSLNETYRRPINGVSNKIYVSSSNKNFKYGFDHFKILFLNGTCFGEEIPLQPIQETDLFVGSFEPPNKEYFYIQVTTYIKNRTTVSRISSTAMNTADGFGEDQRNPALNEYKPIFKSKPGSSESKVNITVHISIRWLGLALFLTAVSSGLGAFLLYRLLVLRAHYKCGKKAPEPVKPPKNEIIRVKKT